MLPVPLLIVLDLSESDFLDCLHYFIDFKDVISIVSEECPPQEVSQLRAGPFLVEVLIDFDLGPSLSHHMQVSVLLHVTLKSHSC